MPSESKAQQRAAAMAEHATPEQLRHAGPAVQQMAKSMSKGQLHEFSSGSMKHKPEHKKAHKRGDSKDGRQPKPRGGY